VIQSAGFTTDFLKKINFKELFDNNKLENFKIKTTDEMEIEKALTQAENDENDANALKQAKEEDREIMNEFEEEIEKFNLTKIEQ
jgi:hypothetical protein